MAEEEIIDVDGGEMEEGISTVQREIMADKADEETTTIAQKEYSEEGETVTVVRKEEITGTEDIRTETKTGIRIGTDDGIKGTEQTGAEDPTETTPTKGVQK
jgi:hypothetical protein